MALFGPIRTASINGKRYAFVIIDDYSQFNWVMFFSNKDILQRISKFSVKRFKDTKVTIYLLLEVIMEENLKTRTLKLFLTTNITFTTSLLQDPINKME